MEVTSNVLVLPSGWMEKIKTIIILQHKDWLPHGPVYRVCKTGSIFSPNKKVVTAGSSNGNPPPPPQPKSGIITIFFPNVIKSYASPRATVCSFAV